MTEDSKVTIDTSKEKHKNRLSNFFEQIIMLMSLWISIILFVSFHEYLPALNWPYHLDKVLIFLIVFLLINFTLDILKPLIVIAILVCALALTILFISNHDIDSSTSAQQKSTTVNIDFTRPIKTIQNIIIQHNELRAQVDSIKIELDSIKQKMKLRYQPDSIKVDLINNKDAHRECSKE